MYTEGNIPLAAGYLKSFALENGVATDDEISIIPRDIANAGGDAAVLDWILKDSPDIVGFSSYMWNVNRNVQLARAIKEKNPGTMIVLGGPEIQEDHPALESRFIDAAVIGEGEQLFSQLVTDFKKDKNIKKLYRDSQPLELAHLPNPYLSGILEPHGGESIFFETMRGCPYMCKYCFYSKSYSGLRFYPEEEIPRLFEYARAKEVPEIYIMDPSFNVSPLLKKKLELIHRYNTTRIPIHTETRLEGITPEIADLMQASGFHSVEAGLQTVNETSLRAIGRDWNREKFIRGAQLLMERDIDVKTGVIMGLPYDDPEDFVRTLDFVMELNLETSMEIYPLSLIPGTRLRDDARIFGLNYMNYPPYWVLGTRHMDERDLKQAVEMVEHKLEIEFFPPMIPRFENTHPDYIHFIHLGEDAGKKISQLMQTPRRVGHSLTILAEGNISLESVSELGEWLRRTNPSTLVQYVIDRETMPTQEELDRIKKSFYEPGHYFNRIHHYKIDPQGAYSLRFFHLTGNLDMAEDYLYRPLPCDLILKYTPGLLEKGKEILEQNPLLLVETAIDAPTRNQLQEIYHDFQELLIITS